MIEDLLEYLRPRRDSEILDRHRAQALGRRIRAIAQLFAVLAVAWVAVDAVAFAGFTLARLLAVRLAASAGFIALALSCAPRIGALRPAEIRLAFLFLIPALLHIASMQILGEAPRTRAETAATAIYALVPFALAAGIAAFPLNVVESAALATIALLAEGWAFASAALPIEPIVPLGAFWLLTLIAAVASFSAMSQQRLLEELLGQAMRDPLTGCHRRESGKEFLEMQLLIAQRHRAPLTVLFADLDRFKAVNDRFGHEEGDRVLAEAAAALRRMTRESDLVLRWGGEEFVVVLPHTTREQAVALLDRLRVRGLGSAPDGSAVTMSIGIAEHALDGVKSAEELVELADRRMYRAKQAGRNRYVESEGEARPLLPQRVGAA